MAANMVLGDVVLFEADESCISQLICELSGSNVSHAAMYYDDTNKLIVEEGLAGIQLSPAPGGPTQTRSVYLRRFGNPGIDRKKLIDAATRHLDLKEPYSISNLVMVGVLLISERFVNNKPYSRAVMFFLKLACSALAEAINKKMHPGKLPMTCSQFVSQCYTDAGYNLKFDNKLISHQSAGRTDQSLADIAVARLSQDSLAQVQIPSMEQWAGPWTDRTAAKADVAFLESMLLSDDDELRSFLKNLSNIDPEEILDGLCCLILKLLQKEGQNRNEQVEETPEELLAITARFAAMAMQLETPGAKNEATVLSLDDSIQKILELRNIFVSPGDLLDHCINLKDAGTIDPPK